jgi:hypothetical protein
VEFTALFPEFPKSDKKGYATIVHLPDSIQSEKKVMELIKGMQYSRSNQGGGGARIKDHIEFFGKDTESSEEAVPMAYSSRTCAGVKVCEYFPEKSGWHTEIDMNGHQWAARLADQERMAANTNEGKIFTLYNENKDDTCERPVLGQRQLCKGRTVIRSLKVETAHSSHQRLFIGCEYWQPREKGHIYRSLENYDPIQILRIWGRERCHVHQDLLDSLNFHWEDSNNGIYFQFIS